MNIHTIQKLVLLFAAMPLLLACVLPGIPSPAAPNPTPNPGSIQTIVVATAGAAQTQTALVLPSPTDTSTATLAPSPTLTETTTATATVIFIIPTATNPPTATKPVVTQSAGSSCQLVSQSPTNDTTYAPRDRFNVEWTIKNTGDETWFNNDIDFYHSGGRDMHGADVVDLPKNVREGDQVTLRVEMRAPGDAGTYTSEWTLGPQSRPLCMVSVRIVVQ